MTLISSGIDEVRAIELPGGIWADGNSFFSPRIALVNWRSSWSDKFYQVYVNGQFAGATNEPEQRQMLVHIPTSLDNAVRIEVFAVDTCQLYFCLRCPHRRMF